MEKISKKLLSHLLSFISMMSFQGIASAIKVDELLSSQRIYYKRLTSDAQKNLQLIYQQIQSAKDLDAKFRAFINGANALASISPASCAVMGFIPLEDGNYLYNRKFVAKFSDCISSSEFDLKLTSLLNTNIGKLSKDDIKDSMEKVCEIVFGSTAKVLTGSCSRSWCIIHPRRILVWKLP